MPFIKRADWAIRAFGARKEANLQRTAVISNVGGIQSHLSLRARTGTRRPNQMLPVKIESNKTSRLFSRSTRDNPMNNAAAEFTAFLFTRADCGQRPGVMLCHCRTFRGTVAGQPCGIRMLAVR